MNTLEQFEQQREGAVEQVKLRDAIVRLSENPDFKFVIREKFLVEECARFARATVNPQLSDDEKATSMAFAQAAGYLKLWLNMEIQKGNAGESSLVDLDNYMDEIRAEQANEE